MKDVFDSQFIEEMKGEEEYVPLRSEALREEREMKDLVGITPVHQDDVIEPSLRKRKKADQSQGDQRVCSLLFEYLVRLANKLVHRNWRVRRNSSLLLIEIIKSGLFERMLSQFKLDLDIEAIHQVETSQEWRLNIMEYLLGIAVAAFIKDEFCDFADSVMKCPVRDELLKLIVILRENRTDHDVMMNIFSTSLELSEGWSLKYNAFKILSIFVAKLAPQEQMYIVEQLIKELDQTEHDELINAINCCLLLTADVWSSELAASVGHSEWQKLKKSDDISNRLISILSVLTKTNMKHLELEILQFAHHRDTEVRLHFFRYLELQVRGEIQFEESLNEPVVAIILQALLLQINEQLVEVIKRIISLIPKHHCLLQAVNLHQIEKWLLSGKIEGLFVIESKEFSEPYSDLLPVLSFEIQHSMTLRVERFSHFFRVIFRTKPQYSNKIIQESISSLATMNNFSFVILCAFAAENRELLNGPGVVNAASIQYYDLSENPSMPALLSSISSFQILLNKLAEQNPDQSNINLLRAALQNDVITPLRSAIHSRSFQEAPLLKANLLQMIKTIEDQFQTYQEQLRHSLMDSCVDIYNHFIPISEEALQFQEEFACVFACALHPPVLGSPLNPILQPFYKLFKHADTHRSEPLYSLCWSNAIELIEYLPSPQRKEKAWKQVLDSVFTFPLNLQLIKSFFTLSLLYFNNHFSPPSYTAALQQSAQTIGSLLLEVINEIMPAGPKQPLVMIVGLTSFLQPDKSDQLNKFLRNYGDYSPIINELARLLEAGTLTIEKKNNILQNLAKVYEVHQDFLVQSLERLGVPMLKLLNSQCQAAAKTLLNSVTRLAVLERNPFQKILCYEPHNPVYMPRFKLSAQLRNYQRGGVEYIRHLANFNLNCALCDEMGLGKTLQALCVISQHILDIKPQPANILVICPASLLFVWIQEVKKFGFDSLFDTYISIDHFKEAKRTNRMLILSYSSRVLQLDRASLSVKHFNWDYLVLDEAHFVRNPTTQVYRNIKQVQTKHILALSGTPLQNRVTDLWALFDILNPGIIEDNAKTFRSKFERPLKGNLKSLAENKNLAKKQSFVKALKELQNRVAPFILRRIKEDVLTQLPPRMIEDYFCKPSASQIEAISHIDELGMLPLEDIAKHRLGEAANEQKGVTVLKSLTMHRKLASHPYLITRHPGQSSGKIEGLVSLLQSLQIINESEGEQKGEEGFMNVAQISGHKALIFFQFQEFLQLVEKEVCEYYGIQYLVLKSAQSPAERAHVADLFNRKAEIRVLLAMTGVGGTGFTLTGADTVIFAEHDWNPANDLQAMDRAHRIGQTRPVNVYRLIVEGSIQEKVMQLQAFKQHLASNLVLAANKEGQDNSQKLTNLLRR